MANIMDYLDWRGDIPFSTDPFNEVDNLILSYLSYVDFEGIVPPPAEDSTGLPEGVSIYEACRKFWELHTKEEIESRPTLVQRAPFILEKLCSGVRFGNIRLTAYVNTVDAGKAEQMSAVTCVLDDTDAVVAFRGTDDTIVGWKEDFSFGFSKETQGQRNAMKYLSRNLADWPGSLRVCGHSKGGNFAVYAAAFCDSAVKERITDVYTNDSPGFLPEVSSSEEYQGILPRVHGFIPEESIFGMLLEAGYTQTVIKSSYKGIWQHDPMGWIVERNRFEKASGISDVSVVAEKALEGWISSMDMEERKEVVDSVFSIFDESGVEYISDITIDQFRSVPELVRAYQGKDPEERRFLRRSVGSLLRSGLHALTENVAENLQARRAGQQKGSGPESLNQADT